MFYYLSEFKEVFSALNIFRYITFRAGMAAVTTFLFCVIFGPLMIKKFRMMRFQEKNRREDCPDLSQYHELKEGTPTMGGILIIGSIVLSVLLWSDLSNHYIALTLLTCIWLAVLGFVDDFIKLIHSRQPRPHHEERRKSDRVLQKFQKLSAQYDLIAKRSRRGLHARTKFLWQLVLGSFVGSYIYFHPEISTNIDIPFFKNLIIDLGIFYIVLVIATIVGTCNAVNLTDGLDGLAIVCALQIDFEYFQNRSNSSNLH